MAFVLDCSMTMAWIFSDEDTPRAAAVQQRLLDETALVPGLWPLEVANVLLAATRRGRLTRSEWSPLLAQIAALPIEVDRDTAERAMGDTLGLADRQGLSVYDAAYLELAHRTQLPLATLDKGLAQACREAGVPLV